MTWRSEAILTLGATIVLRLMGFPLACESAEALKSICEGMDERKEGSRIQGGVPHEGEHNGTTRP